MLPPTSDSLLQHLKQSNYQTFVWRHAFEEIQDLEPPEGHGWVRNEELFCIIASHKSTGTEKPFEQVPACETDPAPTQDLCAQKGATAWQTMKHPKTRMFDFHQ